MQSLPIYKFIGGISRRPIPILALSTTYTLSACSSLNYLQKTESAMPIEVAEPYSERIIKTRVFETDNRLYVTGIANTRAINTSAHVHIGLLNSKEVVVASELVTFSPRIKHPRITKVRNGRRPYFVSFPMSAAKEATKARVTYHSKPHKREERR